MIEDVKKFNEETGLNDVLLSFDQAIYIITEEAQELSDAYHYENNDVLFADALIDTVFATLSCGERLGYDMQALWDEVVRSNMSKVGAGFKEGKLQKGPNFIEPDFEPIMWQ